MEEPQEDSFTGGGDSDYQRMGDTRQEGGYPMLMLMAPAAYTCHSSLARLSARQDSLSIPGILRHSRPLPGINRPRPPGCPD